MADLVFDPNADAALTTLEASNLQLFRRVNEALQWLETDPSDPRVRRIRFHQPALWCITVVDRNDESAVLWEPDPDEEGVIIIRYAGPASFD